jgi:hypothetical protein
MILPRALVCFIGVVLAALPVFEKICDLACAAPVVPEARSTPSCHPAPREDSQPRDRQERDHPCDHNHQVEVLVSAIARSDVRSPLAPAVLSAPDRPSLGVAATVSFDRPEPSESPPLRSSRSVLRL